MRVIGSPARAGGGVIGQARRRADRTIPSAVIAAAEEYRTNEEPRTFTGPRF
jgi:hypothetical protein